MESKFQSYKLYFWFQLSGSRVQNIALSHSVWLNTGNGLNVPEFNRMNIIIKGSLPTEKRNRLRWKRVGHFILNVLISA